jgi:hypothetical protein
MRSTDPGARPDLPDTATIISNVEADGWTAYSRASGLTASVLRSALTARGAALPAGPTTAERLAREKTERENADALYLEDLATREYLDWDAPDRDALFSSEEMLDPSGRFAASFGWRTVGFTDWGPVDVVAIDVELLTARRLDGRPPLLQFVVYELNDANRTQLPRPCGFQADRGDRWVLRHQNLAMHLHDIAMSIFHELNPHAGLLEDIDIWHAEQALVDKYDLRHSSHIWYCHPDTF